MTKTFHLAGAPGALFLLATALFGQGFKSPVAALPEAGFTKIFDGTMKNWDCDPNFWKAVDGVMVGETTAQHQPPQNIFCIWKAGHPADFELKLEYRMTGAQTANSGIQYRSVEMPEVAKWVLKGYQADIDMQQTYTGQVYEERGRAFLATRGQVVYVPNGGKAGTIGTSGDSDQLKSYIRTADWNEIHIIARGNTLIQMINGHVTAVVVDDDVANRKMSGLIGIQLHKTPNAMKMEARNIRLKTY
ncbi:MAG TPA: DUF1080 domain-containing protein [Bryobacteraceae bacterium]|nr:DUF1080 domain-containing protein [Bryobacteraceae bacterium]